MKILLLGSGGREHALAWKIAQSKKVDQLYIAPGNAGTGSVGENVPLKADDFEGIRQFVLSKGVDMVVVGPEDPLVKGVYDFFKNDNQLKDIPVIGPLLFDQSPMVYLTILLVVFTSVFFNRTRAGLSYKSVGEHPQAAATLGINVIGVKYLACMICGALAGMGGAYLTTCYSSTYTDGIVAGRGFIALAAVIFGRWSAGGILLACLFFGFCDALQIRLQVSGIAIPYQFFQMIPYVATVIVLSVIGTKQAGPKANGQPYRKEQR